MPFASADEAQEKLDEELVTAARKGNLSKVKQLLADGANINAQVGVYYNTALIKAITYDRHKVIPYLIEQGADINVQGGYYLPLHTAIQRGMRDLAEVLLRRGARIYKTDGYSETAFSKANRMGGLDAKLLIIRAHEFDKFLRNIFTESAYIEAYYLSYSGFSLNTAPEMIFSPLCTDCIPNNVDDTVIENTVSKEALWVLRAFFFDLMRIYHAQENIYWPSRTHRDPDSLLEDLATALDAWKLHRVITERQYEVCVAFFTPENLKAIVHMRRI